MDLRYYFQEVNFDHLFDENQIVEKSTLGYIIQKNNQKFKPEDLKKFDLAIIGLPDEEKTPNKGTAKAPDEIRKQLYKLNIPDTKLKIIDFGNLKKGTGKNATYYAIRDIIDLLIANEVTAIVIGGGQDLSIGIARAFSDKRLFQLTSIDPKIDTRIHQKPFTSQNYISRILKENPAIFNINILGYQSYFASPKHLEQVSDLQFETIRLGNLKSNLPDIEPILRDSHFVSFDISAIKQSEAPGFWNGSPSGLSGEESCKIARYAGISDEVCVFGLFEVNPDFDINNQTSKLASQIIWYFIEGNSHRMNDFPTNTSKSYTQYNVEIDDLDSPLIFYQNSITQRWWMEISEHDNKKIHISCAEHDYKNAANKEIPQKWLKFIQKIDRLSK